MMSQFDINHCISLMFVRVKMQSDLHFFVGHMFLCMMLVFGTFSLCCTHLHAICVLAEAAKWDDHLTMHTYMTATSNQIKLPNISTTEA